MVENKIKKTIAIYPGSFNPFTIVHQNILEKSERIFGKGNVIISIRINSEKYSHLEDEELREFVNLKIDIIEKQISSTNVEYYFGFLTEYVREKESEGYKVVVIRGLRNGHDFDYEYKNSRYCWDQHPEVNFVYIPCDPLYTHISSSAYRALEKVKPGAGYRYLAGNIEDGDILNVTVDMVELQTCAVVENNNEVDMLLKYDIVPIDSVKNFSFAGTYKKCLEWIKEKEKNEQ